MHEMQTKGPSAVGSYIQKSPIAVLLLLFICLVWNGLVAVAFVYFAITCTNHPLRNILVVFVLYVALATGPVGVSRYRVPLFPFLLTSVMAAAYTYHHRKQLHHA